MQQEHLNFSGIQPNPIFGGLVFTLYSRRSFWEQIDGKLLQSPFENPEAADADYNYVNGIYERMLPRHTWMTKTCVAVAPSPVKR